MITRTWIVNGESRELRIAPLRRLLDVLREDLSLVGTKEGCGEGECGACTVLLNGEAVLSCLLPAGQVVDGSVLLTIEGLEHAPGGRLLQQCFAESGAAQCGFCIPGMLLSAYAFLQRGTPVTDASLRAALAGNICRCTGYVKIFEAVTAAADAWAAAGA